MIYIIETNKLLNEINILYHNIILIISDLVNSPFSNIFHGIIEKGLPILCRLNL